MKIWRFGQIRPEEEWPSFVKHQKIGFSWMSSNEEIDFSRANDLKNFPGWTCIEPWVKELKKGDLIILANKTKYAGIAIACDGYKFRKNDLKVPGGKVFPCIPVKFIHVLKDPVDHGIKISSKQPRTFSRIHSQGFSLYPFLEILIGNFPKAYLNVSEYLTKEFVPEAKKISRVCWNTHDWKFPTGPEGKDSSNQTFEGKYGFGHEEWLADTSHEINGFCYGFLQPLNVDSMKHVDKVFDIDLIAFNRERGVFHVGQISNAICISSEESKNIFEIYKRKKILNSMKAQVNRVGGDYKVIDSTRFISRLFNFKFACSNLEIFSEMMPIANFKDAIGNYRYNLLNKAKDFVYVRNDDYINTDIIKQKSDASIIFIDPIHKKIQNRIYDILNKKRKYHEVKLELNSVDIVARKNKNSDQEFYEIKTFATAKRSIREALGQILEYAYCSNNKPPGKLIIVSENNPGRETIEYMQLLRKRFRIPVYYQPFIDNDLGKEF